MSENVYQGLRDPPHDLGKVTQPKIKTFLATFQQSSKSLLLPRTVPDPIAFLSQTSAKSRTANAAASLNATTAASSARGGTILNTYIAIHRSVWLQC